LIFEVLLNLLFLKIWASYLRLDSLVKINYKGEKYVNMYQSAMKSIK